MKKFIAILSFIILILIGVIVFLIVYSKKEASSIILPEDNSEVVENITTGSSEVRSGSSSKKLNTLDTANTKAIQTTISISEEERVKCIEWQMAHAYAADGRCNEKLYTQEYLTSQNQNIVPSQSLASVNSPQINYLTYRDSRYNFSIEYQNTMSTEVDEVEITNHQNCQTGGAYNLVEINKCNTKYLFNLPGRWIFFGEENLNGGVIRKAGIRIYEDGGSSTTRSSLLEKFSENTKVRIGNNNFYYMAGQTSKLYLLKDTFIIEIPREVEKKITLYNSPYSINFASLLVN